MQMMVDVPGVKLEQVSSTRDEVTFSVVVDGNDLGRIAFVKYYEPVAEALDQYVALWAGPTLCVIDRHHWTMRCIDREDVTHRIFAFETAWIVEGELNLDLFDPKSVTILATYGHNEVIMSSSVTDGLVRIEDFSGATVTLDPRRSLQVV
jgi:hypothetical protein